MRSYFKQNFPILILLTVLVLITYANSLNNAFVSDDIAEILNNPKVGEFSFVLDHFSGFIRPFLYFLTYHVGGLNPTSFRMINILFHLGNTWLIYALVKKLHKSKVALISSAIFAVHPILTEPVSWISGGAYVQAAFFLLLSYYLYLSSQGVRSYNILSLVAYILALVSQIVTVTLVPILILHELLFGNFKKNLAKLVPIMLITAFFIFINYTSITEREQTLQEVHYQQRQIFNPLYVSPIAITSYLELIFFPKDLTLYHSELIFDSVGFLLKVVGLILYLAITIYFLFKNKHIFFWLSLFFISLVPTLVPAFLGLTWIVAERYVYLASLGIIVPISIGLTKLAQIKILKTLEVILILSLVIALTIRSIIRNNDWHSEDNLWIATGKTSPSSPNTHNNLGDVYGRGGDLANSIKEFQTAIALKPNYADAYHNLGNAYHQMGKLDLAMENYQKAAELNPNLWQSYQNISALNFMAGDYQKAEEAIKQAIKINPKSLNLEINLGVIYLKLSKIDQAKQIFTQILQIDPNNQQARLGLIEADKIIP